MLGVIIVAILYPRLRPSRSTAVRGLIVAGVAAVVAALVGWFLITFFEDSWLVAIERLGPAFLVIGLIANPNGAVVGLGFLFSPLLPWRHDPRRAWKDELVQRTKLRDARAAVRAGRGRRLSRSRPPLSSKTVGSP